MKKSEKLKFVSKAQRKSFELSERTNKALKLNYLVVRNGKLIQIKPDGTSTVLRDAVFDTVKIDKEKFTLIDE